MQYIMKASVAALGFATAFINMAAADKIEFKFERYSLDKCPAGHIIQKNVNLDNDKCKTFDKHEPPFHAFIVPKINHGDNYLDDHHCEFIAYEGVDCKGQGFSSKDIKGHIGECATIQGFAARSVYVKCEHFVAPIVSGTFEPKTVTDVYPIPISTSILYSYNEVPTVVNYGSMASPSTTTIHTTLPTSTVTAHVTTSTTPAITATKTVTPVSTDTCDLCEITYPTGAPPGYHHADGTPIGDGSHGLVDGPTHGGNPVKSAVDFWKTIIDGPDHEVVN